MVEHLFKKIAIIEFFIIICVFTALIILLNSTNSKSNLKASNIKKSKISIKEKVFGLLDGSDPVMKYMLINSNGFEIDLLSYGATLKAIYLKDKNKMLTNLILGFDTLEG